MTTKPTKNNSSNNSNPKDQKKRGGGMIHHSWVLRCTLLPRRDKVPSMNQANVPPTVGALNLMAVMHSLYFKPWFGETKVSTHALCGEEKIGGGAGRGGGLHERSTKTTTRATIAKERVCE